MQDMNWSFKQKLSVRASTLLLIFCPIFFIISRTIFGHSEQIPIIIANIVGALGASFIFIFFASFVFGLAFFISSIINKNPQLQYIIEVLLSIVFFVIYMCYL